METDALLSSLAERWGAGFAQPGCDPDKVRAEWQATVDALTPAMIRNALDHLPAQPLSAWGFRALAVMHTPSAPAPRPQQGAKVPPSAIAQRERAKLADVGHSVRDPLAWARRLQQRERSGERLTPTVAAMWRDALRWEGDA